MDHVCPWWLTPVFDNWVRRWLQPPGRVVDPYVRPGMRVADIGCGMGYFTVALAERVGPGGHVFAVDLQEQQLEVVRRRAQRAGVAPRVTTVRATGETLAFDGPVDFVLLFWMLHEVPDRPRFLDAVKRRLVPGGRILVAEPRIHVSAATFEAEQQEAKGAGLTVRTAQPLRASHVAVLVNGD